MDLTKLRKTYTYWRNQARSRRRSGRVDPGLERQAREAARIYHTAIRKQKKTHWHEFLEENANIWQAAMYLDLGEHWAFDEISPLKRADDTITSSRQEQASELTRTFFLPLPAEIYDEGAKPQRALAAFPRLTMEEVERQTMAASPWKAAGEDGLPVMVWKQVWPVVKERV
ncbi:hypothetical protein JX266_014505, partial [Neoarthrinium moseri]